MIFRETSKGFDIMIARPRGERIYWQDQFTRTGFYLPSSRRIRPAWTRPSSSIGRVILTVFFVPILALQDPKTSRCPRFPTAGAAEKRCWIGTKSARQAPYAVASRRLLVFCLLVCGDDFLALGLVRKIHDDYPVVSGRGLIEVVIH